MIIKSLDHLKLISNKIADNVTEKDCIFLIGEIGVGKTTFTRNFINYLQKREGIVQTEVLSPTFNLLYEYEIKSLKHGNTGHVLYKYPNKMYNWEDCWTSDLESAKTGVEKFLQSQKKKKVTSK